MYLNVICVWSRIHWFYFLYRNLVLSIHFISVSILLLHNNCNYIFNCVEKSITFSLLNFRSELKDSNYRLVQQFLYRKRHSKQLKFAQTQNTRITFFEIFQHAISISLTRSQTHLRWSYSNLMQRKIRISQSTYLFSASHFSKKIHTQQTSCFWKRRNLSRRTLYVTQTACIRDILCLLSSLRGTFRDIKEMTRIVFHFHAAILSRVKVFPSDCGSIASLSINNTENNIYY